MDKLKSIKKEAQNPSSIINFNSQLSKKTNLTNMLPSKKEKNQYHNQEKNILLITRVVRLYKTQKKSKKENLGCPTRVDLIEISKILEPELMNKPKLDLMKKLGPMKLLGLIYKIATWWTLCDLIQIRISIKKQFRFKILSKQNMH